MANEQDFSFEAIDRHIESNFKPGPANLAAAAGTADLCGIYKTVKPILGGVLLIPFIPAKWKEVVRAFMAVLDTMCPAS